MNEILTKKFISLFFIVFVEWVAFGMITPFMSFYGEYLGASYLELGMLVGLFSLATIISSVVLGWLSDRYKKKSLLLITLGAAAVAQLFCGLTESLLVLLIARFITGASSGSISIVDSFVCHITSEKNRVKGLAYISLAMALGFIAGPAIGGFIYEFTKESWNYRMPFLFSSSTYLAAFILCSRYIQEPDKAKGTNGFSFSQVLKMVKSKQSILFPILSLALIGMIISSNLVLFPIWSNQVHGWHALENSFIFSLFGLVIVLMQSIGVSLLSKKLGMNRIPTIASLLVFVSLILLSFSFERINLVYVGIILLAAGYGIISPVNTSIISLQINLNGQGTLMGILNFVKSIGELAGSIAIPIMYDFYGPKMLFPQMTVIAMLILILTISINRKRSHEAR